MGILVITVDLECCCCRAKITKVLDCLKEEFCIEKVEFEDKKEKKVVVVRGKFDAEKLCKKVWCKAGNVVKEIVIAEVWPMPPPPKPCTPSPCKPKPEESKPKPEKKCRVCEHCKPKPEKCCVCDHCKPKPKPEEKPKPAPPKTEYKLVPYPVPNPGMCQSWPWQCPPHQQCQCCQKQPPPPPPPQRPTCSCSSHATVAAARHRRSGHRSRRSGRPRGPAAMSSPMRTPALSCDPWLLAYRHLSLLLCCD
ncbi:unnamed protein product [Miscanthus lutarioriparius]|uniref:Uncharacterized protein n=1 Tax=Miscanthus lutarioriparius TaxID=422564 RepID=A0A811QZQ1_9POAL|nr:unnamed protein product [Miscanthus lutarioriparius]